MIGANLLVITDMKSHIAFRLLPKSVSLRDLERDDRSNGCVISTNSVAFYEIT